MSSIADEVAESSVEVSSIADEVTESSVTVSSVEVSPPDSTAEHSRPSGLSAPAVEPVDWQPCGQDLDCGRVAVPLDHDVLGGPTVGIGMVRVPATGRSRGSIFVNPGGPGGSGVDFVTNGFRLDPETATDYDLVGFDPRGIGSSESLSCQIDRASGPLPDFSPDTTAEAQVLDQQAAEFAASCADLDRALLPHLGTDSVARDLDLLRRSVASTELHYIGFSYGTLIGLVYAELFPDLVGHLVLDGIVDPTLSLPELLRQQTAAFNDAFLLLDAACGNHLTCPSGGIAATHDAVVARLERNGAVGTVGSTEVETAALITLYNEQLWPRYAHALDQASRGDYQELAALSDLFLSAVSFASYVAVICVDGPRPAGAAQWTAFSDELGADFARFGEVIANELRPCAFWPVAARSRREPIAASGAKPILVIGTTNDPATPLVNAISVASSLDDGRLIVFEGDRHTAYSASSCVREIVRDYFVDDTAPSAPVTCRR